MKLGYVCQYFSREYGGPVTNLMYELSKSIDVVNYSSVGRHMQYHRGGVHDGAFELAGDRLMLRRYGIRLRLSGLVYPRNLDKLLREDRPDVLQSEEYYQPASEVAYKHAKKYGKPFIFNHRGSGARDRTLRERLFFAYANPRSRRLVEGCDAIVCLSEAGKRALAGIFPQAEGKARVIPNSIDPEAYLGSDGAAFRREHGILEDNPLLLCVARLHPQKRIDLLVRSFHEVKMRVPDSVLCVVGPWFPGEKSKVDRIIFDLKLEDVVFTGPIANERVKDAYAAADVVAMTSEYEPFGYCLLEAMCLSKPAVSFSIGAVPEIIEDGVSGYNVPFADTPAFAERVVRLFNDGGLGRRMGAEGLRRVNRMFHIRDSCQKLISLYRELGAN